MSSIFCSPGSQMTPPHTAVPLDMTVEIFFPPQKHGTHWSVPLHVSQWIRARGLQWGEEGSDKHVGGKSYCYDITQAYLTVVLWFPHVESNADWNVERHHLWRIWVYVHTWCKEKEAAREGQLIKLKCGLDLSESMMDASPAWYVHMWWAFGWEKGACVALSCSWVALSAASHRWISGPSASL